MPTAMPPDTPPWRPMEPMRSEPGQAIASTLPDCSTPLLRCWHPKKRTRSNGRFRSESSLDEPIGGRRHIRPFPRKQSSRNRILTAAQALDEPTSRKRQSNRNRNLPAGPALEKAMKKECGSSAPRKAIQAETAELAAAQDLGRKQSEAEAPPKRPRHGSMRK